MLVQRVHKNDQIFKVMWNTILKMYIYIFFLQVPVVKIQKRKDLKTFHNLKSNVMTFITNVSCNADVFPVCWSTILIYTTVSRFVKLANHGEHKELSNSLMWRCFYYQLHQNLSDLISTISSMMRCCVSLELCCMFEPRCNLSGTNDEVTDKYKKFGNNNFDFRSTLSQI